MSTRYSRKFDIDHVYWDPELRYSEFAEEIKECFKRNFDLYNKAFDVVMKIAVEKGKKGEFGHRVYTLDEIRNLIPIAAYTNVIFGCNVRALYEHFSELLSSEDPFVRDFAKKACEEIGKVVPKFFENMEVNSNLLERKKKLREKAEELFKKEWKPVKESVQLFYEKPMEETVLTQILYPYCTVPFSEIFEKVCGLNGSERKEIFELANFGRESRESPVRGYATRPIIFEIEAPWSIWKDFKRHRMNLRFQQDMRGKAGFYTPELIGESDIADEYKSAQEKTSELIEKVYQKFGYKSTMVASQGSMKRFLLCMDPHQLTVLTELRTIGEGDKGYRKIASKMIELVKEQNPRLFGHVIDNYKKERVV